MKKINLLAALLSVGLSVNLLADRAEAATTAPSSARMDCRENVNAMCSAYCWSGGNEGCIVHWENRESCQFHIDGCVRRVDALQ